jgi:hypothetical protein
MCSVGVYPVKSFKQRYKYTKTKQENRGNSMFEDLKLKFKMARMTTAQIMNTAEKLFADEKAETPVKALFMIFIIAVLAGALLPTGIASLKAANTTSWTTSEIATYGIITIMVLIAVVMLIARLAME